jgi:2-oxoisovalerate dehydrogenase E1 component
MIRFCSSSINISTASLTIVPNIPARTSPSPSAKPAWCVSAEILDLRSLSPYDWEAIATTVKKTNRVIVAYEDTRSWGYGAEIAARIADELFYDLDGPVRRVAATDTFCAYQPKLEDAILPQTDDIVRAVRDLMAF